MKPSGRLARYAVLASAGGAAGFGAVLAARLATRRYRSWTLCYQHGRFAAEAEVVPGWRLALAALNAELPCLHPDADWPWKVRFPAASGEPERTLGDALERLCDARQRVGGGRDYVAAQIVLSEDQARAMDPQWVEEVTAIMADDPAPAAPAPGQESPGTASA